jgi:hypothetical protein
MRRRSKDKKTSEGVYDAATAADAIYTPPSSDRLPRGLA